MSVVKEVNSEMYHTVLNLLREKEKYRNSDRLLMARMWSDIAGGFEACKNVTMYDFLTEYIKDSSNYPTTESVGRLRRKIQEELPDTRGARYKARKKNEDDMKDALGYPTEG